MSDPRTIQTPYDASLLDGLIVEASAGTGKTYTLTTLVARLLAETSHRIDDLAVVTFTVAATGELRTRVWETLRAALDAVSGRTARTQQARELAEHWRQADLQGQARTRLMQAIRDFDRANITTIHGFCQRALREFALDAGLPFKFGVSGDGELEMESATHDFWRRAMAPEPVALLEYAKAVKFLPDDSADWAGTALGRSSAIRPDLTDAKFADESRARQNAWRDAFEAARDAWADPAQRSAFDGFWNSVGWRQRSGTSLRDEDARNVLASALDANDPDQLALDAAGYFATESLSAKRIKKAPPPVTPPFDALDRLASAAGQLGDFWLLGRRRGLLTEAAETLHHHGWDNRQLTFDALLSELHKALTGSNARTLAKRMRKRYPIALIDEFQDTDRLQARIFEAIYPDDGLIVVGDPKQSIYRFRGADVFAYVDARRRFNSAQRQLRLKRNYRSTPALIDAVNALFARDDALVLPEIGFEPAIAASGAGALSIDDEAFGPTPFQLHDFRAAGERKWNKGDLRSIAAAHAAERISALLELARTGKAVLTEAVRQRPLIAGDVAVLVRTSEQGRAMILELRARGIRTVEIGTDSVFDSDEAVSLHRLLEALATDAAEADATIRLRGALAADLFGLDLAALDRLQQDDQEWTAWLDRAHDWRHLWRSGGVASLVRHLLFADDPACASHLLAYPDGPRRLTNFLHLADLLHDAETRDRLSRRGLLDWFAHVKARPKRGGEAAELRLESDEDLVKIVTVHRAKGLEFPVVFCPFAWWGRPPDKNPTAQYYDLQAREPVLHLQPPEEAQEREKLEAFADEVRLMYVAITRAKYHCELTWALARDSEHSPLAWLLGEGEPNRVAAAAEAQPAISVQTATVPPNAPRRRPETGDDEIMHARELHRRLGGTRQLTSFSAINSADLHTPPDQADEPDHDADDQGAEALSEPTLDPFGFPAGSRVGNCLHDILERHAQSKPQDRAVGLAVICRNALNRYGIDAKWLAVAESIVDNAWHAPLGTTSPGFRLADLDRPVAEMEFHLPVQHFRRDLLAGILAEHGYRCRVPEGRQEINGFLHGFIDMVAEHDGRWYVLDYKSNWLGSNLAAYDPAAVKAAMGKGYELQYLLYLTALDRLLRLRLPGYDYDRHIGGACYLFLRGMRPDAPGHGVHFDKPKRECIAAISDCLGHGWADDE